MARQVVNVEPSSQKEDKNQNEWNVKDWLDEAS